MQDIGYPMEPWLTEPLTLSASYVLGMVPVVERHGLDPEALLQSIGLSLEQLRHPGFRLSFARALRLFATAQELAGDALFSLRLGAEVRPRSYPVLGYAAMSCATLGEAISRLISYERLVWNLGQTELVHNESDVCLIWRPVTDLQLPPAIVELAISGWVHLGRQLVQYPGGLVAVVLAHPARVDPGQYEHYLGAPVRFEAGWNGVVLAPELLDQPLVDTDPALCRMMDEQAASLLENYRQQVNLAGEVRAAIGRLLKSGEPDLEKIAVAVSLSPKVLSRRLAEQGASFVALLDEVRRDLAQIYLKQDWSLLDIAFLLGFSEQSAFTRAFKRWTGESPGQYRRQAQRSNPP